MGRDGLLCDAIRAKDIAYAGGRRPRYTGVLIDVGLLIALFKLSAPSIAILVDCYIGLRYILGMYSVRVRRNNHDLFPLTRPCLSATSWSLYLDTSSRNSCGDAPAAPMVTVTRVFVPARCRVLAV